MDRIQTGIPGFDEIIGGGIPKGSSVLVSGGTGTCKTIFSLQYIYNGAKMFQEPGLFVSIETNVRNISWNMESFNWDIRDLQGRGFGLSALESVKHRRKKENLPKMSLHTIKRSTALFLLRNGFKIDVKKTVKGAGTGIFQPNSSEKEIINLIRNAEEKLGFKIKFLPEN